MTALEEVLLFNAQDELTEAAACNVFIASRGKILTPALDHHILPGVTRRLCLDVLAAHTDWSVEIRPVTRAEVCSAEESGSAHRPRNWPRDSDRWASQWGLASRVLCGLRHSGYFTCIGLTPDHDAGDDTPY